VSDNTILLKAKRLKKLDK